MKKVLRLLLLPVYFLFDVLQRKNVIAKDTKDYVWWKIFLGMSEPGLKPKRCIKCARQEFEETTKDTIEGHVCEAAVHCKHCKTVNGYWAYGSYYPY